MATIENYCLECQKVATSFCYGNNHTIGTLGRDDASGKDKSVEASTAEPPQVSTHELLVLLQETQFRINEHRAIGPCDCSLCAGPSDILARLEAMEQKIRAALPLSVITSTEFS